MSHFTVSGSGHLTCTSTGSFTVQETAVEGGGGSGSVLPDGDEFAFYFTNEGGGFVNFYLNGGQGWDNSDHLSHLSGGGTITMRFKDANDNVSEEDIIKFCKETLAGFKCPKKVIFRELPKTSTGKILKYELREIAKAS